MRNEQELILLLSEIRVLLKTIAVSIIIAGAGFATWATYNAIGHAHAKDVLAVNIEQIDGEYIGKYGIALPVKILKK